MGSDDGKESGTALETMVNQLPAAEVMARAIKALERLRIKLDPSFGAGGGAGWTEENQLDLMVLRVATHRLRVSPKCGVPKEVLRDSAKAWVRQMYGYSEQGMLALGTITAFIDDLKGE